MSPMCGLFCGLAAGWLLWPAVAAAQFTPATTANNNTAYALQAVTKPAAGQFYTDPVFGTRIEALTDAATADGSQVPYSYWPPWNSISTKVWFQVWPVGQRGQNAIKMLYDWNNLTGAFTNPRNIQNGGAELLSEGLIWSRTNPALLYGFAAGFKLYSLVPEGIPSVVKDLGATITAAIPTATSLWQMSMGGADRYFAWHLLNASSAVVGVVVYDRQTDTTVVRAAATFAGVDEVHLTRDGALLQVSMSSANGVLWDFAAHPTAPFGDVSLGEPMGHNDFGPNTTMVATNSPAVSHEIAVWDLASVANGSKTPDQASRFIINLKDATATTTWPDHHMTWQNLADPDPTVVYLAATMESDQTAAWRPYFEEIIKVWTDGSGSGPSGSKWRRLAHHRSEVWGATGGSYASYPKGAVDTTGRWYAWSSNWQKAAVVGGSQRTDVLIVRIPTEAEFAAGNYLGGSGIQGITILSGSGSIQ